MHECTSASGLNLYTLGVGQNIEKFKSPYPCDVESVFLHVIYAALDAIRNHALIEVGKRIDARLNQMVFAAVFKTNLKAKGSNAGQALNNSTSIHQFFADTSLSYGDFI